MQMRNLEMFEMLKKEQLKGTCYFEILPKKYENIHWNASSVYFREETFLFFESIIYKIAPEYSNYGHWGITLLDKECILLLCEHIKILSDKVKTATTFKDIINDKKIVTIDAENIFSKDFEKSRVALLKALNDFEAWLLTNSERSDTITILGI